MIHLTDTQTDLIRILPIVEGHGELTSVPALLKRLADRNKLYVNVDAPIRGHSSEMLKEYDAGNFGIEKQIRIALHMRDDFDVLFIFIDADVLPEPICTFFQRFYKFCSDQVPHEKQICIVFPNKEFEAWFLGGITSLAGKRNIPDVVQPVQNPEDIRGAKEKFRNLTSNKIYDSITDQAAFVHHLDFDLVETNCRSFRKLNAEFRKLLTPY